MKRADNHATVIRFTDAEWEKLTAVAVGLKTLNTCPHCGARHKRAGVAGLIRIAMEEYMAKVSP
jgi:hypothetical protein